MSKKKEIFRPDMKFGIIYKNTVIAETVEKADAETAAAAFKERFPDCSFAVKEINTRGK